MSLKEKTTEYNLMMMIEVLIMAGFVRFFGQKIQGLFKDFQGHIFNFSRTPRTAKSKDVQLLIVAIVLS